MDTDKKRLKEILIIVTAGAIISFIQSLWIKQSIIGEVRKKKGL
ncbi:hypothetical protein [Halobacillus ihumii]|nr:hypothetical protein [Halobacillus ihumii]